MHELLLYAHVPPGRQTQLLNVLAGLSAMQPFPVEEQHVLFKPSDDKLQAANAARLPQVGGSQKVVDPSKAAAAAAKRAAGVSWDDLHFLHLVREIDGQGKEGEGEVRWTKQMHEIPNAGVRGHVLRHVRYEEVELPGGDEALKERMQKDGFNFTAAYTLKGSRFILNNTILQLYQIIPSETLAKSFDPALVHILEAKIRISDGANPKLVKLGQEELDSFAQRVRGIVKMKTPDMKSLDTRAR